MQIHIIPVCSTCFNPPHTSNFLVQHLTFSLKVCAPFCSVQTLFAQSKHLSIPFNISLTELLLNKVLHFLNLSLLIGYSNLISQIVDPHILYIYPVNLVNIIQSSYLKYTLIFSHTGSLYFHYAIPATLLYPVVKSLILQT